MKKMISLLPLLLFCIAGICAGVCAGLGKWALCAQVLIVGALLALALGGVLYAVRTLQNTGREAARELEKEPAPENKDTGEKKQDV